MDAVFRALSDRNRLRIVMILRRGPLTVNEISSVLGLTQPNASRHLKALHEAGILARRGVAGRAWYSIETGDDLVEQIAGVLDRFRARLPGLSQDMAALSRCYDQRKLASRDFFARKAGEWDSLSAGLPDPASYIGDLSEMLGRGDTVVELGCGTGGMIGFLGSLFRSVIGVDSSPEMLDLATRASGGAQADFRLGALEHLPVADASADAALAHMVLHHLADPSEAFSEVLRVLRPGGRLVVADLSHHSDEDFRSAQGDIWPGFGRDEIESWAFAAGFAAEESVEAAGGRMLLMKFGKGGKG